MLIASMSELLNFLLKSYMQVSHMKYYGNNLRVMIALTSSREKLLLLASLLLQYNLLLMSLKDKD